MSCIGIILVACLALFVAVNIFLVWASADVGSNIYVKTYCKGTSKERCMALTFDDGPHERNTAKVLDVLKQHDIRATFFLVGKNVERHPELVRRMVEEGHTVAIHTHTHAISFPLSTRAKVKREIEHCQEAIYRVTGLRTRLFRPPFGVTTPGIGRVIKGLGLSTIGWSIRSYDTMRKPTREKVTEGIVKRLHPGAIVLLHDRCEGAEALLEMLIGEASKREYRFVALNEMLNIKGYYEN